jgi:hypothetical protein
MLLIKIELSLAILSLLGSTRTDNQALPPLTFVFSGVPRIALCQMEGAYPAKIETRACKFQKNAANKICLPAVVLTKSHCLLEATDHDAISDFVRFTSN